MRVHFLLFLLFLILLPVQTGKHFWPDWSFVHGIRVDYLSPTLFLTDLLVLLVLVAWFLEESLSLKKIFGKRPRFLMIGLLFLLVSSFLAARPELAFYKLLKLVEFSLLGFYVSQVITCPKKLALVVFSLAAGVVWSSLLAWAQFWLQSSLSALYLLSPLVYSFFQLLGERTFDIATFGIAKARWGSQLVLRPYATFPHPNVLAGFITVILLLVLTNLPLLVKRKKKPLLAYYSLFILIASVTLLISFSRSAWIVSFLATGYWFLIRQKRELTHLFKKRKGLGLVFLALGLMAAYSSLIVTLPWLQALKTDDSLSVIRRVELAKAALRMTVSSPLWGIGLGNFVPRLFDFSLNWEVIYWLQPVHNVFLLIAAETGLVGLGFFLWFLAISLRRLSEQSPAIKASLLAVWVSVLALAFFDHYFFTLQSTQLLFFVLLGLSWARIKKDN